MIDLKGDATDENNCERFVSAYIEGGTRERQEKNACESCEFFNSKISREVSTRNERFLEFTAYQIIEKHLEIQAGFIPSKHEITPLVFQGIVHLKDLFVSFERALKVASLKIPKM